MASTLSQAQPQAKPGAGPAKPEGAPLAGLSALAKKPSSIAGLSGGIAAMAVDVKAPSGFPAVGADAGLGFAPLGLTKAKSILPGKDKRPLPAAQNAPQPGQDQQQQPTAKAFGLPGAGSAPIGSFGGAQAPS